MLKLILGGIAAIGFGGWYLWSRDAIPIPNVIDLPDDFPPPSGAPTMQASNSLDQKIIDLAVAISNAEGFGVAGAIPTRFHNPGDLKPPSGDTHFWAGQTGVGTGGHATFATDSDGWNALYRQLRLMATGKSAVYSPRDTLATVAVKYAENWQPWINIVVARLNGIGYSVSKNTTLEDFFYGS